MDGATDDRPETERRAARAATHAALGDPHRLAVVESLLLGDRSASELAAALGIATNLLAHHLEVLERAGLAERVASSGDRRRRYWRLRPEPLAAPWAVTPVRARRVLFVCTHNSARSHLAVALWNREATAARAASAGTHPAGRVDPRAVAVARRHGLDLAPARPRALAAVEEPPDLVITVCDRAHEELPGVAATGSVPRWAAMTLHWSIPDPAETGTDAAFEAAFQQIARRVAALAPRVTSEVA